MSPSQRRPEMGRENENWSAQLDELLALEAIYGQDFHLLSIAGLPELGESFHSDLSDLCSRDAPTTSWAVSIQLSICPDPPISEEFWPIVLGERLNEEGVRYLPPFVLSIQLTPAYPSDKPPLFNITSNWLSKSHIAQLEAKLECIWSSEGGPGLPIIHSWTSWLQNEAIAELLTSGPLVLLGSKEPVNSVDDEEQNRIDSALNIALQLKRYDMAETWRRFQQGVHTCSICFEEKPGKLFLKLDCGHSFCLACLQDQARIHVEEGSLAALRCPNPECQVSYSPHILRTLLPEDGYQRWETLTLQRTLDSMPDASYCPRCGMVSLEDLSENTADCPKCLFVFCTLCMEGRHPGVKCVSTETRLAMLRKKAEGGGASAVAELRRQEHEMMSLAEIEKTSKQCPSCGMAIQRSEGCNKMVCLACAAAFCYLCGKQISGYDHFRAGGSCVLFDEAEILRWERRWEEQIGWHAAAAFRNDVIGEGHVGYVAGVENAGVVREPVRLASVHCPRCGQTNYKFARNNHMCCWSCSQHFCGVCFQVLHRKGGGHHFGPKGCKQHS